ncbi:MAG: hypothetical protein MI702_01460, partial [Chlorobiales bacterium]|nr:hypothetical protein [Chlorobiales bacterium]
LMGIEPPVGGDGPVIAEIDFPPPTEPKCDWATRSGDADCDDGKECTDDVCINGFCEHIPRYGELCDDGDPCTRWDICTGEECVGYWPIDCDDGNPCTDDYCVGGECFHDPNSGPLCGDDGNACTVDQCQGGECIHFPHDCGDPDDPCLESHYCDALVGCVTASVCDDSDPCTADHCEWSGSVTCTNTEIRPLQHTCADVGCGPQASGQYAVIPLDDDDDNGNGIADFEEAVGVPGEEVKQFTFSGGSTSCGPLSGCSADVSDYIWRMYAWTDSVAFFLDPDLSVPAVWSWPPPTQVPVWGVGKRVTDACGDPLGVGIYCQSHPVPHYCYAEHSRVIVAAVREVGWRKALGTDNYP